MAEQNNQLFYLYNRIVLCSQPLHRLKKRVAYAGDLLNLWRSLSVMTVTLALLPSRSTTQPVKPFDLMSVSSLVSSVILLMRGHLAGSSLPLPLAGSACVLFRDFFRVSSVSSAPCCVARRADSKTGWSPCFTLTSWASPCLLAVSSASSFADFGSCPARAGR